MTLARIGMAKKGVNKAMFSMWCLAAVKCIPRKADSLGMVSPERYPVLAHHHDDDHDDRDDIGHEPAVEDGDRAVARQRQRKDNQQDQLDDRLNRIADELHSAADEAEKRHIQHVADALGRDGRREEHRHADFCADTGEPEEITGQRERTHQGHDGPDHPGDHGGGGDQLGAAPGRMVGSWATSTVPSPSTVNGAMRLIAAMAVADSPTSDAWNARAATAQ